MKGTWDSIHVFEVDDKGATADYRLTSTVMLNIETEDDKTGGVSLSGSMTRQESRDGQAVNNKDKSHVNNMGSFIEDMESKMRTALNTIYFGKTKDIVNDLRVAKGVALAAKTKADQENFAKGAAGKKKQT